MVREPLRPQPGFQELGIKGQGNPPRGRPGWTPVQKGAPKKDPKLIRAVWREAPPKKPILKVVPGAKPPPPREGKKRKAKSISYNVGKSTQIHRPAIATDEKEASTRPNYKGDQAKARAAWLDPVKRGIKESLRLGGVIWTCNLQGFPHVGFMGNMASDQTGRVPGGSPKRREFSSKALRVPVKLARSARIPPWENLPGHRRTAS